MAKHSNGLSCEEFEVKFNEIQASRKRRGRREKSLKREIEDLNNRYEELQQKYLKEQDKCRGEIKQLQQQINEHQIELEVDKREQKSKKQDNDNLNYKLQENERKIEELKDENSKLKNNYNVSKCAFKELLGLIENFRKSEKNYYLSLVNKEDIDNIQHYTKEMIKLRNKLYDMVDYHQQ